MPSTLIEYQLVLTPTDGGSSFTITSVRSGTNPYLKGAPRGDGSSFDPLTGQSLVGAYVGEIADWPIGSMQRVMTAQLENATSGQQRLAYSVAVLSYRLNGGAWVSLVNGYLTLLRLTDAMTFEYTVSDPMTAMTAVTMFGATLDTTMTAFIDRYPVRGCILGGPVMGGRSGVMGPAGWMNTQDYGGWTMQVEPFGALGFVGVYTLAPVRVYGPPNWLPDDRLENFAAAVNAQLPSFVVGALSYDPALAWSTIRDSQQNYLWWVGLTLLVDGVPYRPTMANQTQTVDANGQIHANIYLVDDSKNHQKIVFFGAPGAFTPGQNVRVRCLTVLPTSQSPIYLDKHPVDLITDAFTLAGLAYDATVAAATKVALGSDYRFAMQITEQMSLKDFVDAISLPFGLGVRGGANGLEVFLGRIVTNDVSPLLTITDADVVRGSVRLVYELDPKQAVNSIEITEQMYSQQPQSGYEGSNGWQASGADSVVVGSQVVRAVNPDTTALPFASVKQTFKGMIHWANSQGSFLLSFVTTLAAYLFDRFGHAPMAAEMVWLRGGVGDGIKLGDECIIDISQLPNHNYRIGDNPSVAGRCMQVVRRTEMPTGYDVRLVDSGPNAQPLPTVPTLSIAASSTLPRTVAMVTITNAAALNALGYTVRVQWAMNQTGSAPAASQYADVQHTATYGAGNIPTGAFPLPAVQAGTTIYVQARSEGVPTKRPSAYGATAHVTLSAINDPSSLTATPSGSDASLCALAWTPGTNATDCMTDVYLRIQGAAFSTAIRQTTLNPGTIQCTLENLVASTAYTASVQHRDPQTGDVSDPVDVNFTAGSTVITLPVPAQPQVFAGSIDPFTGQPRRDGVYGIAVLATRLPCWIEVQEAVETSPGSGSYGAFATVGQRIAGVVGGWTIWQNVAPNDGCRRQLQARTAIDGYTASSYTTPLTILPWAPIALVLPNAGQGTVQINTDGSNTFNEDGFTTQGSARWAASTSAFPNDATTAASGTLVIGPSIPATSTGITLTFGQTVYVTVIPFDYLGRQMAPVHLHASFQSYTTTKTANFSAHTWLDVSGVLPPPGVQYDASFNTVVPVNARAAGSYYFGMIVVLPDGATITAVEVQLQNGGLGHAPAITVSLQRMAGNAATVIASGSPATGGIAWRTVLLSGLSEATAGNAYHVNVSVVSSFSSGNNGVTLGNVTVSYTTPNPSVGI